MPSQTSNNDEAYVVTNHFIEVKAWFYKFYYNVLSERK